MEKTNKRKAKAVALATAAVLVLAGTIAYLADASGTIRNVFDNEHIRVQINETGITDDTKNIDNGDKNYTVLPGTSESKDPTITVDTDTDAYVFAVVKDTINSHTATGASEATKFVNYTIADGWVELDKANLAKKEDVKKYIDILNNKTEGSLTVDPTDENTKIYYRIVHGSELANGDHDTDDLTDHRFTYNLLTNDQISYPTTLTNEDMELLSGITTDENKALIFQTWAIQMEPFCPADEVATADPTTADQKQYAKDAWNETTVVPTGVTVSQAEGKTEVGVGKTLPLTATVTPKNAVDKTVTWSSSDTTKATVDADGVVTGVAAGEVTITAAANGATGVSGTYAVTVEASASVSYAVQLYSIDGDTANFGPAVSNVTETSVQHAVDHSCIHNATWAEIKANPAAFSACIGAGCTKSIELDTTKGDIWANGAAEMTTTGDGVGVLYDELESSARVWNSENSSVFSGKYEESNIKTKLDSLLTAFPSDLRNAISEKTITYKVYKKTGFEVSVESYNMNAKLYLLSENEHKSGSKAYARGNDGTGTAVNWWLRDCSYNAYVVFWSASKVDNDGNISGIDTSGSYSNLVDDDSFGVAPGFSISK